MPSILPGFPDQPQHSMTVVLDDRDVIARLTWRERPAAWYLDLLEIDETPIILGRRVVAQWLPVFGFVIDIAGQFVVLGTEGYDRDDLADSLQLVYFGEDEVRGPELEDYGIRITAT